LIQRVAYTPFDHRTDPDECGLKFPFSLWTFSPFHPDLHRPL
jgi:hypothetical protein